MNVLQIMGCTSDQYASMEIYLIKKAKVLAEKNGKFFLIYENNPKSTEFVKKFVINGGGLFQNKANNISDLRYFSDIISIIKRNNIKLVHTYFSPTCHYVNINLFLRGFKNIVRTAPNLPLYFIGKEGGASALIREYFSLRQKLLSKFVKKIICRSKAVVDEYMKIGVSPQKLTLVPGGVDIDVYQFYPEERKKIRGIFGIGDETLVLGAFCRLVSVKRLDRLIKNFHKFYRNYKNAKLLIAGDGPEFSNLKKLTTSLNLNDVVYFLGNVEDISCYYSALDVFCLPSRSEGMSNSILEAMASELPVIVGNISPNIELIDNNQGGFLISFDDSGEFIDIINRLLNRETRRKMGIFNRNKVATQLSLDCRIKKELTIYREITSEKN